VIAWCPLKNLFQIPGYSRTYSVDFPDNPHKNQGHSRERGGEGEGENGDMNIITIAPYHC